jgi:hypothetical protein
MFVQAAVTCVLQCHTSMFQPIYLYTEV